VKDDHRRAIAALAPPVWALLFALMTVALQVRAVGLPYLQEGKDQWVRHRAVLDGTAIDPWQYRVLSEGVAEGFVRLAKLLHVRDPAPAGFIAFRLVQDTLLFLLAWIYYRRLGVSPGPCVVGLACLAWGMSNGIYNSDLQFSTYSDVIFYLLAGMAVLRGSLGWIPFLSGLAGLNRETSLLIPLLPLAGLATPNGRSQRRNILKAAGLSMTIALAVFLGLRYAFGPRPPGLSTPPIGLDMLAFNLGRYESWLYLFATLGPFPVLAVASLARWPTRLRAWFWILVPAWFLVHFLAGVVAEARLFLVPHVLVFVPGALLGVAGWESAGGSGREPEGPG